MDCSFDISTDNRSVAAYEKKFPKLYHVRGGRSGCFLSFPMERLRGERRDFPMAWRRKDDEGEEFPQWKDVLIQSVSDFTPPAQSFLTSATSFYLLVLSSCFNRGD